LPNNWGSSSGLTFHSRNAADEDQGMVAYTTSTYNTGWMNGDIKGAFLSDTDDTDLVGSGELVTNGTFDTDSDWTKGTGWTISGGVASCDGTQTATTALSQTKVLSPGTYVIEFDITAQTLGSIYIYLGATIVPSISVVGHYVYTFTVTSTTTVLYINGSSTFVGSVDNISVKLADEDRSVNNNGLIVNGTVTRTAVATGADLVAYSGFSASNYLEQPYNSDLDFGTGDFCVMGWGRTNVNGTFLSRGDGVSVGSWYWRHLSGSSSPFYIHDGTAFRIALNTSLPQADMVHFALLRRSGAMFLYGNGELMGSSSGAYPALSITNLTAKLRIGDQQHSSYSGAGEKQALLRISATAPTADQIAKIYEDEKVLFQENAQATLHGSSDAVTALAHDPDTDLLHVGTSAGRSVFDGLRRIDNTTDAVTTAISASGGFILEQ